MSLHPEVCFFTNRCSSNAYIMVLPRLTFVLLWSWFLSPLLPRWRFVRAPLHGFVENLAIVLIAEMFNLLSFCLKCLKTKRDCPFTFSPWLINPRVHVVMNKFSIISYIGKKRFILFMLSFVYNTMQQDEHAQIQSLPACELFVN